MPLDTILEGAMVYDGSGRAPFRADVGVLGDRIAEVGHLTGVEAARRIRVDGLCLCPGFVDAHSHADLTIGRSEHVDLLAPLLRQGVTTFIGGNCGAALAPVDLQRSEAQRIFLDFFLGENPQQYVRWDGMGQFLDTVERQGCLLNFAMLAPHGLVRMLVMEDRHDPDAGDMKQMEHHLSRCMEEGAVGISVGLQYFPGLFSHTSELVEVGRIAHRYGGVFTAHLRSYNDDTLPQAVDEAIRVGREAQVPVRLSHMFCIPNPPWPLNRILKRVAMTGSRLHRHLPLDLPIDGGAQPQLDRIQRALDQGQPVALDCMPTSAGFTHLIAFLPPWVLTQNREHVMQTLRDPEQRRRIRDSIEKGVPRWPHREGDSWSLNLFHVMGWDMAFVMSLRSPGNQHLVGRTFTDIGKERGVHPFDAMCDVLLEEEARVLAFEALTWPGDPFTEMAQRSTLAFPQASPVTDTILMGFGKPSHLFYDCFPRFLADYSRDRSILPLREAIRKCTSLPASWFGLKDRGLVKRGYKADLVVFDLPSLRSRSTLENPDRTPDGIRYVLVNGGVVVDEEGLHTGTLHGQVLRR